MQKVEILFQNLEACIIRISEEVMSRYIVLSPAISKCFLISLTVKSIFHQRRYKLIQANTIYTSVYVLCLSECMRVCICVFVGPRGQHFIIPEYDSCLIPLYPAVYLNRYRPIHTISILGRSLRLAISLSGATHHHFFLLYVL